MRKKDLVYIILMVFFMTLAYFLFDRGFNARTKIIVNYKEDSNLLYRVYLHDNKDIKDEYLDMNKRYITKLVDNIGFTFTYDNLFSSQVFGYYSYDVNGILYVYDNDSNDLLIKNDYPLIEKKTFVLNENNIKKISIEDKFLLDYDKYLLEFYDISDNYDIDINGYLELTFNVYENLLFDGIDKEVKDGNTITVMIPLDSNTFKISVSKELENTDSYYDFSTKEKINYIFLLLGSLMMALGISFMALVVRQIVITYFSISKYEKEMKSIFHEYDDIIVKVKRFYNNKNYNLIYVDSFDELIDVYKKVGNPISYREIKKNREAIFILMDEDNAWIYRMINEK